MDATMGTIICALGGIAGATFALPFRGIKGMKYESYWMVYAVFGLVLFPLVLGLATCPNLFGLIGGAERYFAGTFLGLGAFTTTACSLSTCLAGMWPSCRSS